MRVVAVIQARMGSTRLPGKVLADIAGRTMLVRVVQRTCRSHRLEQVVVATSTAAHDAPVVRQCRQLGIACFRGDEEDVLDRYFQAALHHQADVVVRVTSDCPLIDPGQIDEVVRVFLDERPDYASNTLRRTFPRGLDNEAMWIETLEAAWREAREPHQRVHVTPFIYEHPRRFRLRSVTGREDHSDGRWTVDTIEDLRFVRAVYERLGGEEDFSWRDVLEILEREPSLRRMNGHVRQKAVRDVSLTVRPSGRPAA